MFLFATQCDNPSGTGILQREPLYSTWGGSEAQASPLPQARPPRRSQEHCNLYTRRDLHWVPRRGWVRGFTLHSDTPRCGQLLSVSCPETQTRSPPLQGLKAAAVVCTEEERRSLGSYEWGCKQRRTDENPSQGGSHSNQGFQSRDAASLSCQTSFTKHKFKQKTKDFKSGRSGC